MKKILNKKGFTLVELLAVIVVLAVIMVIATQAIGGVIQKNTVNSYESSLNMVAKQAKQAYIMNGAATTLTDVEELLDYDSSQYLITFNLAAKQVCLRSKYGGKFYDMQRDLVVAKGWTPSTDEKAKVAGETTACKNFK